MNRRVQALAERFEQVNLAVRITIMGASDEQLRTICPAEQCTVAALACHIASVHEVGTDWILAVLDGRALPELSMSEINRVNREFFAREANASRSKILVLLERGGALALTHLRNLDDADLDRSSPFPLFGGAMISVQFLIEQVLIGDPIAHLISIRAAFGLSPNPGGNPHFEDQDQIANR
jgi:DinB family protein